MFPDRRPIYFLNCYSGVFDSKVHPEENWCGVSNWWRGPDAVKNLVMKIKDIVGMGYRRILLNRPMGGIQGLVCASCNYTLSEFKRNDIPKYLKPYIWLLRSTYPDFEFGIYIGGAYRKLDSLQCVDGDPLIYDLKPGIDNSLANFQQNFQLWMPFTNLLAFDYASTKNNYPIFQNFIHTWSKLLHVNVMGEAISTNAETDGTPYMAQTKFIAERNLLDKVWDPKTSEPVWLMKAYEGVIETDWASEEAKEFVTRKIYNGWVPMTNGLYAKEIVQAFQNYTGAFSGG